MTQKKSVLKSLEDLGGGVSSTEICKHIIKEKYFNFSEDKTPSNTIATICGNFIRNGDTRVRRVKEGSSFYTT